MRVLLVEDEDRLRELLKRGLQEERYAVDATDNGDDALRLLRVTNYDLIILDVMLPGTDGLSVARSLRRAGDNTPILMLTARDTVDDRVAGLDSGADDYLTKPFSFRELLARTRAVLRRDAHSKDHVLRVGDLEMDTLTREVRRGGVRVDLTSREFAVLEMLVRNPNRVLTRSQIAEHVWDYDFTAMSNVVDVYIRYLRRKIDEGHAEKLIHTVRGSGYQIRQPPSEVEAAD